MEQISMGPAGKPVSAQTFEKAISPDTEVKELKLTEDHKVVPGSLDDLTEGEVRALLAQGAQRIMFQQIKRSSDDAIKRMKEAAKQNQ